MPLPYHHAYTGTQLHRVARDFTDAAALAGFVPVATDVGKLYKQLDTGIVYELTNHVGPVYEVFNRAGIFVSGATLIGNGDSGAADAYAVGFTPAITALTVGRAYRWKAANANTGASTLNLQALGAQAIKKLAGGVTTTLVANDIRANQWIETVWDGTNFQMLSQPGNAAAGGGSGGVGGDLYLHANFH